MFNFFAYNPSGHRVDVEPFHVASDPIRFDQRSASAHEGIRNTLVREFIALEKDVFDRSLPKLRQNKRAEKCPRSPGKPFMNRDNGTIVLLDLFLAQS